eukprot:3167110-Heterocapsa_arctica.AAC.1
MPSPPGFVEGGKIPAVSIGKATPNGTPASSQCCKVSASGSRAACSNPAKSVASTEDGAPQRGCSDGSSGSANSATSMPRSRAMASCDGPS